MAEALGVIGLFLNDRGCAGKRNATHWTVKTHVTSCGSTSRMDGKLTTYSNAVNLKLLNLPFAHWITIVDALVSQVHIQLGAAQAPQNDVKDFEGSGLDGYPSSVARQVAIPIHCHSEPNFPIGFGNKLDGDKVMVCGNLFLKEQFRPSLNFFKLILYIFIVKMNKDCFNTDVDLPVVGQTELYHMEIHRNKEWASGLFRLSLKP
jgi:hypothetical protein